MIFRSPCADVTIPDVPLTSYIFHHTWERADKPALIDGASGRALTYGQLTEAIYRAAAGLAACGFRRGEVFAIYCPNLPEYAVVFHAVLMLGGTVTTVNPLYTVRELAHQLQDAGARYLLTVPPFLATARAVAMQSPVREPFVLGEAAGVTPFAAVLQPQGRAPAVPLDPGADLAILPYSSGTTGLPKGVMLTHRSVVANLTQLDAAAAGEVRLQADDAATIATEGWLHTGDVGYADSEGYFYLVDRVKELIKYTGFQVAPAELEALLLTHPAVADAAVIGRPDAEAGEVPIAFVVLQGNATSQELMGFVSERVAPYKRLRHVACVAQIPKSPTGKISCDGCWSSRSRQASVRFEAAVQCRQRRDIALAVDNIGSWSGLAAFPAPAGAL